MCSKQSAHFINHLLISVRLNYASRVVFRIETCVPVSRRRKVSTRLTGVRAHENGDGCFVPRCGEGELLRALWTRERRSIHSVSFICNSDRVARKTRRSFLARRSTPPLLNGECDRVKWCGMRCTFDSLSITAFLK